MPYVEFMSGHIRRRSGRYQAIAPVRTSDGQWTQRSRTFDTRRDAQSWINAVVADADKGARATGPSISVAQLLDEWFQHRNGDWSVTTRRYIPGVIADIKQHLGGVSLTKLSGRDIDTWMKQLAKDGLTPSTIHRKFGVLRQALKQAWKWGYTATVATDFATPPKTKRYKITPPTPAEVEKLIDASFEVSERAGMFVHLAASTGARRGELCALRWRDIDFATSKLNIEYAVVMGMDDKPELKETKTGNRRRITLDPATLAMLRDYRALCKEKAFRMGERISDDGFIFCYDPEDLAFYRRDEHYGENPIRPDYVTNQWRRARAEVGLTTRFHDLRHFAATTMLIQRIDLATVAGRLGHASGGKTTISVYAHFIESADEIAAEVMSSVLPKTRRISG